MGKIRSIIGRHRGLILALVAVTIGQGASTWWRWPRPRLSWTEDVSPDPAIGSAFSRREEGKGPTISPDGRWVLGSDEGRVWIRDLGLGEMRAFPSDGLSGADSEAIEARFLDGGRTVLAYGDGEVWGRAWDSETGELLAEWKAEAPGTMPAVAFSEDGSTLAFESRSEGRAAASRVTAWSRAWEGDRTFPGASPMALSADGAYFASDDGNLSFAAIAVRSTRTGERFATLPIEKGKPPRLLAISEDGRKVAEVRDWDTIILDVASSAWVSSVATGSDPIGGSVDLRSGGKLLYLRGMEFSGSGLEVWDLATNPPRLPYKFIGRRSVTRDGRRLVETVRDHGGKSLVDPASARVVATLGPGCYLAEFGPTGRTLATLALGSSLAENNPLLRRIPGPYRPRWLNARSSHAATIDAKDGHQLASTSLPDLPDFVVPTPDGFGLLVRTREEAVDRSRVDRFDFWDLHPRPLIWPIEAGLATLALAIGWGWDRRSKARRVGLV